MNPPILLFYAYQINCTISYLSCRFGKPFIIDMMEVDMFDTVSNRFDEVHKGLMESIIDKSIMNEEK